MCAKEVKEMVKNFQKMGAGLVNTLMGGEDAGEEPTAPTFVPPDIGDDEDKSKAVEGSTALARASMLARKGRRHTMLTGGAGVTANANLRRKTLTGV